ncbi:hypothetical protein B4U80_11715 [Leptotrombidium deliense]|uniref:Acetylserotonin O-methyltransferase n=1 Tax=Leptotrombidium deliense TaxID=299467 RepID=A0A443S3D2_9ACAR|nr:hypothetical protein B4U80_11715 [Leptotrombidium deliense]
MESGISKVEETNLMFDLMFGGIKSQMIYCAAKLNVVDHLSERPLNAEQIAKLENCHLENTYRLLRGLASIGILEESNDGFFRATKLGKMLKASETGSQKSIAIAILGEQTKASTHLLHSIKTGQTAFEHLHGKSIWKYYSENRDENVHFINAMCEAVNEFHKNLNCTYDFEQFKNIIDIGGGSGAFLIPILEKQPQTKGVIFDLECVIRETTKIVKSHANIANRCKAIAGDFFRSVPSGGDCYVLKSIVHGWNDSNATKILKNVRKQMNENTKLLIIESLLPGGNVSHPSKVLDLHLMAVTEGRERSLSDFKYLVSQCNLKINKVITLPVCLTDIIEVVIA